MALSHEQKLAFIQHMTRDALEHVAKTPNVPDQKGGMSHDKKLAFVQSMTKHGLQHLDAGGQVNASGMPAPAVGAQPNQLTGYQGANAGTISTGSPLANALGLSNTFRAGAAPITPGTNVDQLNQSYNQTQQNLTALQPGVQQGANAQSQVLGQELAQANGQGPNPAQAQFNQNTAENIKNTAALMASQRGASANPGAIARTAGEAGAAQEQTAAGQSATLQAQQQLAAQQNAANLAGTQVAQGVSAGQNEQNTLQNANTSLNNANVGMTENQNTVNAGVAHQNTGVGTQVLGGITSGLSAGLSAIGFSKGGMIPKDLPPHLMAVAKIYHPHHFANGGMLETPMIAGPPPIASFQSQASAGPGAGSAAIDTSGDNDQSLQKGGSALGGNIGNAAKSGGSYSSPDSNYGSAFEPMAGGSDAADISNGMPAIGDIGGGAMLAAKGGGVPGKAPVKGDSLKNDKVPAMLSPGELVIDRETMADKGHVGQMARALAMHIQSRNKKGGAA